MKEKIELGSEFDLDVNSLSIKKNNVINYLKGYNCYFFNSGRSAIKSIPIEKGKILLPSYICDSVIDCFNKKDIVLYKVNEYFEIDEKDVLAKLKNVKTIFIMHYFGKVQNKSILNKIKVEAKKKKVAIIEDTTHSIFSSKSTIGDYMVVSIRKWFPIPNGGILYSKKRINTNNIKKNTRDGKISPMILKNLYLNGKINEKPYLEMFKEEELNIEKNKNKLLMSNFCKYMLSCFDVTEIKKTRKRNYNYLETKLKYKPIQKLNKNECPFVYEIRIDDRDMFREYLINNSIYCAVHWPNCSKKEISIPIDQRYSRKELDYLIDIINKY